MNLLHITLISLIVVGMIAIWIKRDIKAYHKDKGDTEVWGVCLRFVSVLGILFILAVITFLSVLWYHAV